MISIPFLNFASFSEKITLDEKTYTLSFDWNDRGEFYVLTLFDANEVLLIAGRKVSLFVDLLSQFKDDTNFPQGLLIVIDPILTNFNDIMQDDFIDRLYLVYFTEEEINAIT